MSSWLKCTGWWASGQLLRVCFMCKRAAHEIAEREVSYSPICAMAATPKNVRCRRQESRNMLLVKSIISDAHQRSGCSMVGVSPVRCKREISRRTRATHAPTLPARERRSACALQHRALAGDLRVAVGACSSRTAGFLPELHCTRTCDDSIATVGDNPSCDHRYRRGNLFCLSCCVPRAPPRSLHRRPRPTTTVARASLCRALRARTTRRTARAYATTHLQ